MKQITLYLDMDGVLANFDKAYHSYDYPLNDAKKFRSSVLNHKIFTDLELMPDAQELLNFVATLENIKIEILTSVGTLNIEQGEAGKEQKLYWLNKHNIKYKANFVKGKAEKANYADPYSILIDDSIGCITPFIKAGGYGILHTSAEESIKELKNILNRLNYDA